MLKIHPSHPPRGATIASVSVEGGGGGEGGVEGGDLEIMEAEYPLGGTVVELMEVQVVDPRDAGLRGGGEGGGGGDGDGGEGGGGGDGGEEG